MALPSYADHRDLHPSPLDDQALAVLSDEALVQAYRDGCGQALVILFERYRPFMQWKARLYYLNGGDREDLEQEARIGLYEAIESYRPGGPPFGPFARMCITRQILQAVKIANSGKHRLLNTAISLDAPVRGEQDEERALGDLIADPRMPNPADVIEARAYLAGIREARDTRTLPLVRRSRHDTRLTPLERDVLFLFAVGYSYQEMSVRLKKSSKAVDNALQRAKKKLAQHLVRVEER
ncbi:sigma-70 family RNA polymerase sigma factor [Alicyclobacillus sp.]|uniref:sigma-70 family RNA polymerase sigma factor n=1 Tax=Alicyclobacillus sp. TaxID=61169 RepID=UPI0025C06290|nr:sigma-70 family RNA polymerase sigma factor [Alicyclobacillus sp.]MCL6516818.1 sigma-70 family RNA polymerase sigma factor [Alicyclobacillus sp.]